MKLGARQVNYQGSFQRDMLLPKLISEETRILETGATMGDVL